MVQNISGGLDHRLDGRTSARLADRAALMEKVGHSIGYPPRRLFDVDQRREPATL
jgi:hypothetical protein